MLYYVLLAVLDSGYLFHVLQELQKSVEMPFDVAKSRKRYAHSFLAL
jgi:hypothetical protein